MVKKKVNYIEPATFFRATLESIQQGEVSNELGLMFIALSEKYANHPKFVRYFHIREDLIATGVMACCRAFDKYRPDRNVLTRDKEGEIIDSEAVEWDGNIPVYDHVAHYNPFAFFTSVVHNSIIQVLKKEYKNRNIINAVRLEAGLDADYGYVEMINTQESDNEDENSAIFVDRSYDEKEIGMTVDIDGDGEYDDEEEIVVENTTVNGGIIW